jgi:hypothetical protein
MIGSLGLQRYNELFAGAPGPVYLEADAGGQRIPVYRWFGVCGPLTNGVPATLGPAEQRGTESGAYWDRNAGTWWVWVGFRLGSVGAFTLTIQLLKRSTPTAQQLDDLQVLLNRAIRTITMNEQT